MLLYLRSSKKQELLEIIRQVQRIISESKLMLGKWQGISLAEFDGPKEREVIIEVF